MDMKKVFGVIAALFVILAVVIMNPVSVVDSGEIGVVKRFGEVTRLMEPGINWRTPIVESVTTMNVKDQSCDAKLEVSSSDVQTIWVNESFIYAVNPKMAGEVYVKYGQGIENILIKPTLAEVTNAVVAQYPIEEFVSKRAEISKKIEDGMREKVECNGVVVKSLLITNHDFSKEFNAAIEAKKVAEQEKITAQYIKEKKKTEAEADAIKGKALTPVVIEEMKLRIQEKAIEKWDGHMPQYMSGNELPFVAVKGGAIQ